MTEIDEKPAATPRDWKRILTIGGLILLAAIFSFLNADERIAINLGVAVLYRLSLVGVVFSVFLLGMLTMFLFGLRHDRAVREALRSQTLRQALPSRPLGRALPVDAPRTGSDERELQRQPAPVVPPEYDPQPVRPQAYLDHSPEPKPPA